MTITPPPSEPSASYPGDFAFWVALTGSILGLKVVLFILDPLPLFYLGDSGSYLHSAITTTAPVDRSFTYGLAFIAPLLALFGKLQAVVLIQSLIAAAAAILAALCLRVGFHAPLWIAAIAALLYAVEPLALLHERLILTETLAAFFLACFVLIGLCYINRPRPSLLVILALLGACLLSLRTFYIPVILIATAVAVLLAAPHLKQQRDSGLRRYGLRVLLHALVAIAATFGFHVLYQLSFSYLTNQPPAYNGSAGFFLVASWAPLVTPDDFPSVTMAERVLPNLKFDLKDRFKRPNQLFTPGGLVSLLTGEEAGDTLKAKDLARRVALQAGLGDPIGVGRLALQTYADFWDGDLMRRDAMIAQGQRELDQPLLDHFKAHYAEDLSEHHLRDSITKRWHRSAITWYRFLLLSPLLSLVLCIPHAHRNGAIFIGVIVYAVFLVGTALVTEATVRYLHAVSWLVCIQLGILLCVLDDAWCRERVNL